MGQHLSAPVAPAGTVVYDLYDFYVGNPDGCGQGNPICRKPSFEGAQWLPVMEPWISQAEFLELKQRVCALTQTYRGCNGRNWTLGIVLYIVIMIAVTVLGYMYGAPGLHGPLIFILFIGIFFHVNRNIFQPNEVVDSHIRGVLADYQRHLAGRATLAFVTQHTGMCKPKHARVIRQIWFGPPGGLPVSQGGAGYVVGMHHNGMQPQGWATTMVPPPPQQPTGPPGGGVQREVFTVTVPKGVDSGQTFTVHTPSGRVVTVTAPMGAREGLQFQVSV